MRPSPPSSSATGTPSALPLMSSSAISIPAIAYAAIEAQLREYSSIRWSSHSSAERILADQELPELALDDRLDDGERRPGGLTDADDALRGPELEDQPGRGLADAAGPLERLAKRHPDRGRLDACDPQDRVYTRLTPGLSTIRRLSTMPLAQQAERSAEEGSCRRAGSEAGHRVTQRSRVANTSSTTCARRSP